MEPLTPLEISIIFKRVVEYNKDRLIFGMQDRERIQRQISNGESPTGYRVDWIMNSSLEVIDLISELSIKFNQQHEKDRASIQDFIDILNTSIQKLKHALNN